MVLTLLSTNLIDAALVRLLWGTYDWVYYTCPSIKALVYIFMIGVEHLLIVMKTPRVFILTAIAKVFFAEGAPENVNIETAYSSQEDNNFQADLAIDGNNDTCFKSTTGSATSLLLTLDRRRTVVGVSMSVKGRMSRTYHQWGNLLYSTRHLLCITIPLKHMQIWCTINDAYCILYAAVHVSYYSSIFIPFAPLALD